MIADLNKGQTDLFRPNSLIVHRTENASENLFDKYYRPGRFFEGKKVRKELIEKNIEEC